MIEALSWFLAVEFLGLVALPPAFLLFRHLPDRGYTLVKPASLVIFSYVLWILGLTHVVPNSQVTILVILLVGTVIAAGMMWRLSTELKAFLKENWRLVLAAEAIFVAFFLLWLGIVSEAPAINHTEKPMDFGFMNAVLQSRFFPPEDHWLAGFSISYYYFGHFIMAFLTQITGVASSVGYNLGVALIPALTAVGAFGLLYNLVRIAGGRAKTGMVFGLAAALLVVMAGNLEGSLEFVKLRGWAGDGFWDWAAIKGLEADAATGSGILPDQYWWWFRASRVIDTLADGVSLDYTITEFPVFSFILGDLHPHVTGLPFVLLGLGLVLNLYRSPARPGLRWLWNNPWHAGALALFVGSLAFINTWDLPTVAALMAAALLLKAYADSGGEMPQAALAAAKVFFPVMALAVVLFLPFYLDLNSQASGVLPLLGVATRPFPLFLVMGLFILLGAALVVRQALGLARPSLADAPMAVVIVVVVLAPAVLWAAAAFLFTSFSDGIGAAFEEIGRRAVLVLPGMLLAGLAAFGAAQRARMGLEPAVVFVLLLTGLGFYLLVGTELFYVVDSFGGGFRRMNTVFKTYYQVWLLLGVAGTFALYYIWSHPVALGRRRRRRRRRRSPAWRRTASRAGGYLAIGGLAILLAASFYYSAGAALERTGISPGSDYRPSNTLDGLGFLKDSVPGEYAAIAWLRDDAPWGRIVEAVGDDYTEFGRVSSSTGLPAILGWKGHELQWRGSHAPFAGREQDVLTIYTSPDPEEVRGLLQKYGVRYVYLGHRERSAYGVTGLSHLADPSNSNSILETVFRAGNVIVYELKPAPGTTTQR